MLDETKDQFSLTRAALSTGERAKSSCSVSYKSTRVEVPLRDESPDRPGIQIPLDAGEGRLFLLP